MSRVGNDVRERRRERGKTPAPIWLLTVWLLTIAISSIWAAESRAEPRVEVVFVDPGDAVWSRWGHVGIRVIDEALDFDAMYSWGFAPFDQPSFLWDTLQGNSEFYVAGKHWSWSLERYREFDRTVRRRPLNLPQSLVRELVARVQRNAQPENRGYQYDHLLDNCSTRVRDVLDDLLGGALRASAERRDPEEVYRDQTLLAGSGRLSLHIIFDLIGGPNQEVRVDGWASLYLPRFLEPALEAIVVVDDEGREIPLLGEPIIEYSRQGAPPQSGSLLFGRYVVLGAGMLFALTIPLLGLRTRKRHAAPIAGRGAGLLLFIMALIFGVLGLALTFLVVVSKVSDFAWNENVLLFVPLDLWLLGPALAWMWTGRARLGRWVSGYLTLRTVSVLGYVVLKAIAIMPQDNWAFVALAGLPMAALALFARAKQ